MTSRELKNKSDELDTLLSNVYFELTKDGKEYSFIRKALDDEDINDPSYEAMWWELLELDGFDELPIIEVRDPFTGDIFDAYVLCVDTTGITYLPVKWEDTVDDIKYDNRFSDIATTWSKILLIENMENL